MDVDVWHDDSRGVKLQSLVNAKISPLAHPDERLWYHPSSSKPLL